MLGKYGTYRDFKCLVININPINVTIFKNGSSKYITTSYPILHIIFIFLKPNYFS